MAGGGKASSGEEKEKEKGAWEAVSIVLRIVTVGMSLASAVTTLASTQCAASSSQQPVDDASSSCGTYGSFTYSSVASLVSAVLQGVVIWLEVVGNEKWTKTVELIDALVLALTSTSGPLLFAADDITSCGSPRRPRTRNGRTTTKPENVGDKAAAMGLGALASHGVNVIGTKVMKHKKTSRISFIIRHRWGGFAAPIDEKPASEEEKRPPPPCSPPPCSSCSCPTVATAPCCCENRDPCDAWTS
nr:unnamed protein product [Digitaria exilis]